MKFLNILVLFTLINFSSFGATFIKDLLYTNHSLPVTYPYGKGTREFQLQKIVADFNIITNFEEETLSQEKRLGVLRNYKNINGLPAPTLEFLTDKYGIEKDGFGNFRYQGIPLYNSTTYPSPERYALDGELVAIYGIENEFVKIKLPNLDGFYYTPIKYVKALSITNFNHVIFIDKKNQNIMTFERGEENWIIRSMTHATTGANKPPYMFPTPNGIFVLQAKTLKMHYLKDGSKTELEGYAPYANRFSGGGYVHGIPINLPKTEIVETNGTLGTIPRSHKCVRTYSSHAKYIYDWAPILETLIIVID